MKNILIDSDILIDHLKGKKSSNLKGYTNCNLYLSVISLAEVLYGQVNIKGKLSEIPLAEALETAGIKIVPLDVPEIQTYVNLKRSLQKRGLIIGDFDLLIASTAISQKLTLLTKNLKHFSRIHELKTLNQ